jgi:hypothetical protein
MTDMEMKPTMLGTSSSLDMVASQFGVDKLIAGARLSANPKIQHFLMNYDVWKNKGLTLDQIAEQSGVDRDLIVACVAQAISRHNTNVSKMLMAMAQPDIVCTTIDAAKQVDNIEDRRMFYNLIGMTPNGAKGPLIQQNFVTQNFEEDPTLTLNITPE